MDRIEFKVIDRDIEGSKRKSASIIINGINLVDRLKEYELPFAKREGHESIAGQYIEQMPGVLYRKLTKPADYDIEENGKVTILICECREEGCWPMNIKVIKTQNSVIWTEFEQPHRDIDSDRYWDYTEFGQYEFPIHEYELQIEELKKYSSWDYEWR